MIRVHITIGELPCDKPGKKRGCIEVKTYSDKPSEEEVHTLALLLEKMRELGNELGSGPGGSSKILEKNVRPIKPERDRGTDPDREQR